jgi:hypothetical protein
MHRIYLFIFFSGSFYFLIYKINLKICGFILFKLSHKPISVYCGFLFVFVKYSVFLCAIYLCDFCLPLLQLEASMHQGSEQQMPSFNLPSKILCKVVNIQLRVSMS